MLLSRVSPGTAGDRLRQGLDWNDMTAVQTGVTAASGGVVTPRDDVALRARDV